MNFIIKASILLNIAFSFQIRTSGISINKIRTNKISMSSDSEIEVINNNANTFAADPIKINDDADLEIDLDALSQESASSAFQTKIDISDMIVKEERKAPRQAQWFPMLLSPTALGKKMYFF